MTNKLLFINECSNWHKLTEEQIKRFRLSTYEGEVILIDGRGPSEYENRFYFNAQEFFIEEEIAAFPWYDK